MKVTTVDVKAEKLEDLTGIDAIHVFWIDAGKGRGYCTIICYGAAWTAYFGYMGGKTIRQFISQASIGYLLPKFGIGPHLKSTKRDNAYLAKIIDTVKLHLKADERANA